MPAYAGFVGEHTPLIHAYACSPKTLILIIVLAHFQTIITHWI